MGDRKRSFTKDAARMSTTSRGHPRPSSYDRKELYSIFCDNLKDMALNVYVNSSISRSHGLTQEKLLKVVNLPVSEHFHSYLCCCICYENALICAVGDCSHLMCFLCMMRLKSFYENEKDIYMCPYCKQESNFLVVCANPFFAHRCIEPGLYTHDGNPELTQSQLNRLLSTMRLDASVDSTMHSKVEVNIKDINAVFIQSTRDLKRRICRKSDFRMHQANRKKAQPSVDEKVPRDVFRDVYTRRNSQPRLEGGYVIVGDHGLVFENTGMYLIFIAVTSALCWMPECRASWYPAEPVTTVKDLRQITERIYKIRSNSYKALNNHLKSRHEVVSCDICQKYFNEKKFICEMALYLPTDIESHVKSGDVDCIPAVPAHILCTVCKKFQWDRSELKKHAKDEHFFCDICDSEGWVCEVFGDYPSIFSHFKSYHYPCEEEDCMFVVFRDDLQLQLHYMSKHAQKHRSSMSRRQKPQPASKPVEDIPKAVTVSYDHEGPFSTTCSPWNGTIRIIPDSVAPPIEVSPPEKQDTVSEEFGEWISKRKYLEDSEFSGLGNIDKLFEAFAQTMIHVMFGSENHQFDFDTFNVRCSTRVVKDLKRVLDILKSGSFPSRCELWDKLPSDFNKKCRQILKKLEKDYKSFLDASLIDEEGKVSDVSAVAKPKNLLDIVKSYMSYMVVFLYNINVDTEFNTLIKCMKKSCVQLNASPNALMLLNFLEDMIPVTNKILVKQSLDWTIKKLEDVIRVAYENKKSAACLTELVKKKSTLKGGDLHLDMLNPNSDLAESIYQDKQMRRLQNNIKRQGKKAWDTKCTQTKPTAAVSQVTNEKSTTTTMTEDNSNKNEEQAEIAVIENEKYVLSVEEGFKKNLNNNFYAAMATVVRSALTSNESKFNASSTTYRLRETTKIKINKLLTSGNRRFTMLSEFVPMQCLESLQALEPEFHRLVKESRCNGDLDALAKSWSSRCAYALRRCRVEQLEILDYYLQTNTAVMPLLSDAEFPSLGNKSSQKPHGTRRNYAEALNVASVSKHAFRESDFPALG